MNSNLNDLESAVLEEIAIEYPVVKAHIPYLQVASREYTDAGMYINFTYNDDGYPLPKLEGELLSVKKTIMLDTIGHGLGHVLWVADGRANFLELFAYGDDEHWDGTYNTFEFENAL
jgi:hypothetical protein